MHTRTRDVKKQINPSINAHLLWNALILLSLLAICAIPFALAQSRSRGTAQQNVVQPVANPNPAANVYSPFSSARAPEPAEANPGGKSKFPTKTIGARGVARLPIVPYPKAPQVVLYDQLSNAGSVGTSSQEFPDVPTHTDFTADDFVVPSGQTWNITEVDAQGFYSSGGGPADNFNVFFYRNNGGLPGTQVYSATAQSYVNTSGVFQVTLTAPAVLAAGTYWVSVQAHMNFIPNGQWVWFDRTVQANSPAAWQNPAGGFGPPTSCPAPGCPIPCHTCISWGIRQCCTGTPGGEPDQMFRLIGTLGGGTPTPTATGTPRPTATGTPSPIPTATPSSTPTSSPTPGCASYEAESGTLSGSAVVQSCPTCSGQAKVGYVGNNSGTLQFNDVTANTTDRYVVTIWYTNGDAVRYALLSVNGSSGTPVSFPSTGSFQTVGSVQRTITLNAGSNTLKFYNPIVGSWAPDFDRLGVNCPNTPTPTPTPTPTATSTPTPTGAPGVTTNPATNVASFSATLNGTVNPHGLATAVHFQYGTTTSYGLTTTPQTKAGNTYQAVSANISGLTASTTYHFRIVATNSAGTTYGADRTFTTLSATGPPVVTTNPATLIASFSAALHGSLDPHGLSTNVHFEYGTTTNYGSVTASQTKTGNTYQNASANISGLTANTTYHFRIVATNSTGTTYGADRTFTTLSPTGPPVVITNPATNVASSSATLNGTVDPHGLTTNVHFQYGTTTSYGSTTAGQTHHGNTYLNVGTNISGLSASTTYHFRIVATNSGGTAYGSDRTFRTP